MFTCWVHKRREQCKHTYNNYTGCHIMVERGGKGGEVEREDGGRQGGREKGGWRGRREEERGRREGKEGEREGEWRRQWRRERRGLGRGACQARVEEEEAAIKLLREASSQHQLVLMRIPWAAETVQSLLYQATTNQLPSRPSPKQAGVEASQTS